MAIAMRRPRRGTTELATRELVRYELRAGAGSRVESRPSKEPNKVRASPSAPRRSDDVKKI